MKKYILLTVIAIAVFSFNAEAQSYREIKMNYRVRDYHHQIDDYYSPALAGISSAIIPGFGQMSCGETRRGFAFIGGYMVSGGIMMVGMVSVLVTGTGYVLTEGETRVAGQGALIAGVGAVAVTYVWSIVDAVRVAKIKNMYIRDHQTTSNIHLNLSPTIINSQMPNSKSTLGLALTMRF